MVVVMSRMKEDLVHNICNMVIEFYTGWSFHCKLTLDVHFFVKV